MDADIGLVSRQGAVREGDRREVSLDRCLEMVARRDDRRLGGKARGLVYHDNRFVLEENSVCRQFEGDVVRLALVGELFGIEPDQNPASGREHFGRNALLPAVDVHRPRDDEPSQFRARKGDRRVGRGFTLGQSLKRGGQFAREKVVESGRSPGGNPEIQKMKGHWRIVSARVPFVSTGLSWPAISVFERLRGRGVVEVKQLSGYCFVYSFNSGIIIAIFSKSLSL